MTGKTFSAFLPYLVMHVLLFSIGIARAQTPADSGAAREAATGLNARADTLVTRADSLRKSAATLRTRADSLLLATGLKKPTRIDYWSGSFGLGYTLNRGNSEQTSLVVTFGIDRKSDKTRFISQSSMNNTSSKGSANTNKGTSKNKFELDQGERFFFFAALDADYNRRAGIDLRLSPGVGVGIAAVSGNKLRIDFNFGANPVTEFLRSQPDRTKGHYLASEALSLQLNGLTRLSQNVTWKPRFAKTEYSLLNFGIMLASKFTSSFEIKMNLESSFNSRPPVRIPAVRRQDWMFFTAISYSLR